MSTSIQISEAKKMKRQFRTENDDAPRTREITHVLSNGRVTIERVPDDRPAPARKSIVVVNDENNERPATRSPRLDFIAQAGEDAGLWRSRKQRELDRRGDGAPSPRDVFIAGTSDMAISKRARARGYDG
jgi:hypothetical protein